MKFETLRGGQMIDTIYDNEIIIAIIIRSGYSSDGIEFFTPGGFSQQLGYMKRKEGYKIKKHYHNAIQRNVSLTQEVLFIKSGQLKVDLFDNETNYLQSEILEAGDLILLASGGHGFEFLKESEVIEVKQGPYSGDADKTHF